MELEKDTSDQEPLEQLLVCLLLVGVEYFLEQRPPTQGVRRVHEHVHQMTSDPGAS